MCELYAMSSVVTKNISFSLCEFRRHGGDTGTHVDGWGLAFIDDNSTEIYREPKPAALSLKMDHVLQHHKPANLVISHIRKATQGEISLKNTQPFSCLLNNKKHVFAHNGDLVDAHQKLILNKHKTEGETDSEHAFCYLMEQIELLWQKQTPTFEQRIEVVKAAFNRFSKLGQANFIFTDGEFLFAFANERTQLNGKIEPPGLHYLVRDIHSNPAKTKIAGIEMNGVNQEQVLLASVPLTDENWLPLQRNQFIVIQSGKVLYSSH